MAMLHNLHARIERVYLKKYDKYLRRKVVRNHRNSFDGRFDKIIKMNNLNIDVQHDSEFNEWSSLWSTFGSAPLKDMYAVFSNYVNDTRNIVPNDIARAYIEPVLTPDQYYPFYNDKNSFDLFIGREFLPQTLFRFMNGHMLDADYELLSEDEAIDKLKNIDRFIIKPAAEWGGKDIALFSKKDGAFIDSNGEPFSIDYLHKHYQMNYIVQECVDQSEYISQFNPTSVNTLRIATYRDVKTGEISVIAAVLRIGGANSVVDNTSSGGVSVSVDRDGRLGKYVCNKYGQKKPTHNGIDFENNEYIIPEFDKVKDFAIKIAKRLPHMSLFANDIAITKDGTPVLIEVNTHHFSYFLYQFGGQTVFGEKTDQIIKYCLEQQSKIKTYTASAYTY